MTITATPTTRINRSGSVSIRAGASDYSVATTFLATTFSATSCTSGQTAVRARNTETTTRTIYLFSSLTSCQANNTGTSNSNASLTFSSVTTSSVTGYQCIAAGSYIFGDGNGAGGCTTTTASLGSGLDYLVTNSSSSISSASE